MTARVDVMALNAVPAQFGSTGEDHLEWLVEAVRTNRFLPCPPAESIYVGDGDFRSIGAEFLHHFVTLGGLRPTDRVLDVGCGIGRMAVPLTQYLDPERGSYDGVDPVLDGILWCAQTITPAYPRFRFQRLDVAHALYNPDGALAGREIAFGFRDASFDFIAMVSVATHLPPDEMEAYAQEIGRVLAPDGRLFITAFLIDEAVSADCPSRLQFRRWNGPAWIADPAAPLGAVGFDDGYLQDILAAAGLVVERVSRGHWSGRAADHFQDIIVAAKPGRAA